VRSLTLQPDGKILAGGDFSTLGGQARSRLGRLINTGLATQNLALNGSTVTWQRGGTSLRFGEPPSSCPPTATLGPSWEQERASAAAGSSAGQRSRRRLPSGARYVSGGFNNASGWFVESVIGPPLIVSQPVDRTNNAGTTATFSVALSGSSSAPGYQWRKEGVNLATPARSRAPIPTR